MILAMDKVDPFPSEVLQILHDGVRFSNKIRLEECA
jgi:hypothetical protein